MSIMIIIIIQYLYSALKDAEALLPRVMMRDRIERFLKSAKHI